MFSTLKWHVNKCRYWWWLWLKLHRSKKHENTRGIPYPVKNSNWNLFNVWSFGWFNQSCLRNRPKKKAGDDLLEELVHGTCTWHAYRDMNSCAHKAGQSCGITENHLTMNQIIQNERRCFKSEIIVSVCIINLWDTAENCRLVKYIHKFYDTQLRR